MLSKSSNLLGNIYTCFTKFQACHCPSRQPTKDYHRCPMAPFRGKVILVSQESSQNGVEDIEQRRDSKRNKDLPRSENISALNFDSRCSKCLC